MTDINILLEGATRATSTSTGPCLLLAGTSSLFLYQWLKIGRVDDIGLNLGNSILQMLPVIFIKIKLLNFSDRLSLLSRFSMKVLVMHLSLFIVRVITFPLVVFVGQSYTFFILDILGLLGIALILQGVFELRLTSTLSSEHRDLQIIHVAAVLGASIFVYMSPTYSLNHLRSTIIVYLQNMLETMTFMPALWILHQMNNQAQAFTCFGESTSQRQSMYFLAFLFVFYTHEDLLAGAFLHFGSEREAILVMSRIFHFVLMMDFGGFFLCQAYGPKLSKSDDATTMAAMASL